MTQAEVTFDELHAEYLREIASKVRAEKEVERLREALQQIKEEGGKVCAEFELCRHVACQSSVAAWMIADAALARDKAN